MNTIRRAGGGLSFAVLIVVAMTVVVACSGTGGGTSPGPSARPSPAGGQGGIVGRATAGPVCPVERVPPDPSCAARPVAGAVVVIQDAAGREVARTTTNADGQFAVEVPPGDYVVVAQPAKGLMGTPQPQPVTVGAGHASVDLSYDTGIR